MKNERQAYITHAFILRLCYGGSTMKEIYVTHVGFSCVKSIIFWDFSCSWTELKYSSCYYIWIECVIHNMLLTCVVDIIFFCNIRKHHGNIRNMLSLVLGYVCADPIIPYIICLFILASIISFTVLNMWWDCLIKY